MADVNYAVSSNVVTTSGLVDLSIAGINFTPKGVACHVVPSSVAESIGAHGNFGRGFSDGTNQWAIAGHSRDAATTTNTRSTGTSSAIIYQLDNSGAIDFEASAIGGGAGAIPDGWRINVTNAPTSSVVVIFELFGGADLSFACGVSDAINSSAVNIGPGFVPQVMEFANTLGAMAGVVDTHNIWSVGSATFKASTVSQRRYGIYDLNGYSALSEGAVLLDATGGCGRFGTWNGVISVSGSTITITPSANAGGAKVGWVAMNLGGNDYHIESLNLHTSTSVDWPIINAGFTPGAVRMQNTRSDGYPTSTTNGGVIASHHMAMFDGTRERSMSWGSRAGAPTSIAKNVFAEKFVHMIDHDQILHWSASNPQFNTDGLTIAAVDITDGTFTRGHGWAVLFESQAGQGVGTGFSLEPIAMRSLSMTAVDMQPVSMS